LTIIEPESLIDPVCGIVREVADFPVPSGAPLGYRSCVAVVADTRRFAVWLADRVGGGTSWGSRDAAARSALGEAVERYCGNHIPGTLRRASRTELLTAGEDALGSADLPQFSPEQLARAGFPYRAWDDETPLLWAVGRRDDGSSCHVPASYVYLNWHSGERRDEPRITHLQYSGIATGQGLGDAADRALVEVLERDAAVAWWTLGLPSVPVDPASVPGVEAAMSVTRLELQIVALPSEFGVAVLGALLLDEHRGVAAAAFAAGLDPESVALKAVGEATQVWTNGVGLLDPDGPSFQAVQAGFFARHTYLPFREDRHYLEDAGEGFSGLRDLATHVQLWLDRRLWPELARFSPVDQPSVAVHEAVARSCADGLATSVAEVCERLAASGRLPVTFDLTTDDVAETGWRVARVVVPRMITNAPAAYAYLGTPRLAELAARHGVERSDWFLAPPPHN
jgi:ribosomal protein S12 methylthiotransferase accessory factor